MMTCQHVREELELLVGQQTLPAEMAEHLEGCASCRAFYEELSLLSRRVGTDDLFGLTEDESTKLLAGIEEKIAPQQTGITSLRWLRYAAAAAIVTLSVSIGYYEFRKGVPSDQQIPSDSTPFVALDTTVADSLSLSSEDVEQLIREYTSDVSLTSDEELLENLSDEEIEYLEKNLNVGDLL